MAFIFNGDTKEHEIEDESYRSYLITRAPPAIVYRTLRMQLMRLRVHVRSMHRSMIAMWASTTGRYHIRGPGPEYREKHKVNNADGDAIHIPQTLDGKWDY